VQGLQKLQELRSRVNKTINRGFIMDYGVEECWKKYKAGFS
jgi:hypothetical protein